MSLERAPADPEHCQFCRQATTTDLDQRGADLCVGEGWRTGFAWAELHEPGTPYPISNHCGDDFALGFYEGVVVRWCPERPYDMPRNRCMATWPCVQRVQELAAAAAAATRTTAA